MPASRTTSTASNKADGLTPYERAVIDKLDWMATTEGAILAILNRLWLCAITSGALFVVWVFLRVLSGTR